MGPVTALSRPSHRTDHGFVEPLSGPVGLVYVRLRRAALGLVTLALIAGCTSSGHVHHKSAPRHPNLVTASCPARVTVSMVIAQRGAPETQLLPSGATALS